jgi:hypothetical protein
MSRNAHAWFLVGMVLSFLAIFTIWLTALAIGSIWASEWGMIVPFADVAIFALVYMAWRRRWRKLRRAESYSREMRCPWFARFTPAH